MKTSVVIPAYNEEERIGAVLKAIDNSKLVNEIIVVDDGSTDQTSKIVKNSEVKAKLISLQENTGKTNALAEGVKLATYPNLVFVDADLTGLKSEHIDKMIRTYDQGNWDMVIGVFRKGRAGTDISQKLFPHLSGQRVLSVRVWEKLDKAKSEGSGVEMGLTKLAVKENLSTTTVKLTGVSHIRKEEKMGFIQGVKERLKMYGDIIKTLFTRHKVKH